MQQIWSSLFESVALPENTTNSLEQHHSQRLKQCLQFIHLHYSDDISLENIANVANISKSECCRNFHKFFNLTPFDYLLQYRIQQACILLLHTDDSINQIASKTGFHDQSYFSKIFKRLMGMTPSRYRNVTLSS